LFNANLPDLSHYYVSTPHLHLCTENLTPFLSLLPSKGLSGLSALLSDPHVVLAWGFKTEGIDVVMPTADQPGTWTGWWEGVADLVPVKGGSRAFSINSLFRKNIPRAFPRASSSSLRVIIPKEGVAIDTPAHTKSAQWLDGVKREVLEWDLLDAQLADNDIKFSFKEDGNFVHRKWVQDPFG
jgi:phosphatidylinositol glycan class T